MRALFLLLTLTFASSNSFASFETIKVKDRLRILLWTEGLGKSAPKLKAPIRHKLRLPEEIEIPLMKFEG